MNNVCTQEAPINLLGKKGIITKAELLEEIKMLRDRRNKSKLERSFSLKGIRKLRSVEEENDAIFETVHPKIF